MAAMNTDYGDYILADTLERETALLCFSPIDSVPLRVTPTTERIARETGLFAPIPLEITMREGRETGPAR